MRWDFGKRYRGEVKCVLDEVDLGLEGIGGVVLDFIGTKGYSLLGLKQVSRLRRLRWFGNGKKDRKQGPVGWLDIYVTECM